MTDLEEEILFRLTVCEFQGIPALAAQVTISMSRVIPMAEVHKAMVSLVETGLVQSVKVGSRKKYSITESGKAALQREWSYYRSLVKA